MAEAFSAKRFRGRDDDSDVALPPEVYGVRIGAYPVLVLAIQLIDAETVLHTLRQAHNQVVIARSYMKASDVINTHVLFVATPPPPQADWIKLIDLAERDETVCRKLVWIPKITSIGESYDAFLERTFLAQPWLTTEEVDNAPLDQNDRLVENVLQAQGLTPAAAAKWVEIATSQVEDPQERVEQFVSAMELRS
ncbi:ABC-three component system middle component 1 [Asticcacaulis biprosthecium]|uniref:ABC-three component system middle component 1 n=1 Tax=Asticcacaulis biprosthecium TaxID=76891 RepID=UPI0012F4BFF0|nr:ABC-three component system middle component 1 [Asticcacaulis biprosthecium]